MPPAAFALAALALASTWSLLFWGKPYGLSMPLFCAAAIAVLARLRGPGLTAPAPTVVLHAAHLLYLAACVAAHRNGLVLYATVPYLYCGLAALAFAGRPGFAFANALGVAESLALDAARFFAPAAAVTGAAWSQLRMDRDGEPGLGARAIGGALAALPALAAFACLFASADPVFQAHARRAWALAWDADLALRAACTGGLAFLLCGFLARSLDRSVLASTLESSAPQRDHDGVSTLVFLLLNNLLFAGFIAFQLGYLFAGESLIRSTPITYAEYVHRGFYELWAAVILVFAIIAVSGRRLREQEGPLRTWVERSWLAMISMTFVIIASALKRIAVYEEAYGYTTLRVLVGLFMLWKASVFVLLAVQIVRRKPLAWLLSGALCSALGFLTLVSTVSVDRCIARKNADRHLHGGKTVDTAYLRELSADTVPEVRRLAAESRDPAVRAAAEDILLLRRVEADTLLDHPLAWNHSLSRAR